MQKWDISFVIIDTCSYLCILSLININMDYASGTENKKLSFIS